MKTSNRILIPEDKFFISSDYHMAHVNVLKYDNRPFTDIHHHDEQIIQRHNRIIGDNSYFFFCGDFFLGKDFAKMDEYLSRLNGIKYFIKGNHDHADHIALYKKHGTYLGEQISRVYVGETYKTAQMIVLNHFRMTVWDKSHHGSWHLYGHSHGSLEWLDGGKCMDVGIMQNNYYPFSFYDIRKALGKKETKILDHHNGKTNV